MSDLIPHPLEDQPEKWVWFPWWLMIGLYAGVLWLCQWLGGWWLMWIVSVGLTFALWCRGCRESLNEYRLGMIRGIRFAQGRSWEELDKEVERLREVLGWETQEFKDLQIAMNEARRERTKH
jgi:hypothetical protein